MEEVRVAAISTASFDIDYEYVTIPTGSYNLAYGMLLSDKNRPDSNLIPRAKVMIWIHGTASQPAKTYKGDFSDGHNSYALYSWVMAGGWEYYSFIMKGRPQFQAGHTVDAGKLIGNLKLDPNWYIHGVELGNEIWNGTGKIEITNFNVDLNGPEIPGAPPAI